MQRTRRVRNGIHARRGRFSGYPPLGADDQQRCACGSVREVLTGIGMRLKEESPSAEPMMITHTNGSSGYLVTDEAYKTPGYEVVSTRARSGAEDAIVKWAAQPDI